jgi:hypothetical protein
MSGEAKVVEDTVAKIGSNTVKWREEGGFV